MMVRLSIGNKMMYFFLSAPKQIIIKIKILSIFKREIKEI